MVYKYFSFCFIYLYKTRILLHISVTLRSFLRCSEKHPTLYGLEFTYTFSSPGFISPDKTSSSYFFGSMPRQNGL